MKEGNNMEKKKVFKLVEVEMKDVKKGDRIIIMYPHEEAIDFCKGQIIMVFGEFKLFEVSSDATEHKSIAFDEEPLDEEETHVLSIITPK